MNKASNRAAPARSLAGDDNFRVFYRHEYERAVRLAWLLTGSQPVAEDVVQDAMAALYRAFGRVESPSAYLLRAVVNTVRSWHRHERRHRERATLLARERSAFDPADAGLLDEIARDCLIASAW